MPPKESVDLVIEPRWVLPIAPVNTVLADHAVAISDGRIVALGPVAKINALFEPRTRVVRDTHALLPGLVNAHTRAATTLLRGLPVYGPRRRWMTETVLPVARPCMSAEFVREGTQLAVAEMLRAGITAFADMYLFPEEAARVASTARIRAAIGLPVTEGPTPWAESTTGHLAKAEELWDEYSSNPWVSLYFAPHDAFGEADSTLTRVRRVADELDARITMYLASEAVHEHHTGERNLLMRLQAMGLLGPGFTAVHPGGLRAEELDIAAASGISVVACQQAHLRLGEGLCPVGEFDARGLSVGLGTDSPLSVGALDILAEARMAALLSKLPAERVLHMATLGGATALGMNPLIGSIEPDKAADLIAIDLAALACQPDSPLTADAIVFGATRENVSDVWTSGRPVVSDGHLLTFDEQELLALSERWRKRVATGGMS
jgi:5-methylthioadenosine/S-adenosylhomocysteine deaminase